MTIVARKKKNKSGLLAPIVDKNMKSHRNDPFFVKKADKARAFIAKYGVPSQELLDLGRRRKTKQAK